MDTNGGDMVNIEERGWAGHYIAASNCRFRRNTLLHCDGKYIVVSTVGNYWYDGNCEEIGLNRYYETMAFFSLDCDTKYHDIDVSRQIYFSSPWAIDHPDADNEANAMHKAVVLEIMRAMENGTING